MKELKLADDFSVDAIEYASRANACLGIRDSGKTYTSTMIAEQMFDLGIPFFTFDPIGRWRFLRVPGKGPAGRGYPIVVAGGRAPDLPLTPEMAPKYVRAAMRAGVSMVIDLYDVNLSKSAWRSIVRNCIEVILYEGEGHGLRHVFLEEAAEFIPQHIRDGATYAEVEKLARMGGNVGCGLTLINQRAEEVNKAVLELCDNLLLHRQRGKNSLKSLAKWLEMANVKPPREITDTLANLGTGHCWAWFKDSGTPRLIKVATKHSFDPDRRALARHGDAAIGTPADVSTFMENMRAILEGKKLHTKVPAPVSSTAQPKGAKVDEAEARALREENRQQKATISRLEQRLAELEKEPQPARIPDPRETPMPSPTRSAPDSGSWEGLYADFRKRLMSEPAVLQVLAAKPEIEVRLQRKVIKIDGESIKGRIARLLAHGFYDEGATISGTRTELKRTGSDVNTANIGRTLSEFLKDGFVTLEGENRYTSVKDMKVNVVEE